MKNCVNEIGDRCCGCHGCQYICPKSAITFKQNEEGFLYPNVSSDCIECGLCIKKCPILSPPEKNTPIQGFSGYIINQDLLNSSSSGGAFAAIARTILEKGGVVFGCAEEKAGYTHHIKIDCVEQLYLLQGSKYVESEINNDLYLEISSELSQKKKVLFSGTPCQCAAVKNAFGKNNNLYIVDIICHGVPSRKLYKEYLQWLESKLKSKILKFDFRSKCKHGWSLTYRVEFEKRETKAYHENIATMSPYYRHFLDAFNYRESCYSCEFACFDRVSDITLGDFWGIEKIDWKMFNYNGVSAILINSKHGKELWEITSDKMFTNVIDPILIKKYNGQLNHPSKRIPIRETYYKDLSTKGFDYLAKKYNNHKEIVIDTIKDLIPNKIRINVKRFIDNLK